MVWALIRHPTPAIAPGVCYGRTDIGLVPAATAELETLAAALAGIQADAIATSPLRRCREAAAFLSQRLNLPVTPDDRLLERDFGAWEGRAWNDIPRAEIDAWAAAPHDHAPQGGETVAALIARTTAFHRDRHGEHLIIVTHGGPLRLLIPLAEGTPPDPLAPAPPPASLRVIARPSPPAR